jgi:heptosyltransferase III
MPPTSPRHILVIRGGAIGDFVLTLPVLAALRRHSPDCRLVVLGHPPIAQLAQAAGLVDEVHSIAARALTRCFVRGGELPREIASFFARFDLILSYLYDPDGAFHEHVVRCSDACLITGPHRPDEARAKHATDTYLQPLERLGIVGADSVPRLPIGLPSQRAADAPRTVALHPGSGSERKNWPERKWGALLDGLLQHTSLDVLLVGGEAESDRLPRLAAGRSPLRLQLAWNLPLVDLARRLGECAAFVGHDSGITHLAAAVGLSGVVLWGDSVEAVWRPRGDGFRLLRDPKGLAEIPVSRVLTILGSLVEGAGLRTSTDDPAPSTIRPDSRSFRQD